MASDDRENYKNSYEELIPEGLIKEWTLDFVLLTTFTLQQKQLTQLLYEMGAFSLIPVGKVHVFYDKSAREENDDSLPVISEKYLHPISIKDDTGKLYSFHPKVYLLRYKKNENDKKCFRYVVIISSKNISISKLQDAYAVAYGDLADEESENGKHLSEFIGNLVNISQGEIEQDIYRIVADLKKVKFTQDGNTPIRFYTSKEVWDLIKNKSNLTIVSPFLSEKFIKELKENISTLISTEQGLASLDENTVNYFLNNDEKEIGLFDSGSQELHAKIYCWKEEDNYVYIIGSSNATNNGCGLYAKSGIGNIEYNMSFVGDKELYEGLNEKSKQFEVWEIENTVGEFDARKYFIEFVEEHDVICVKEDSDYIVKIIQNEECKSDKYRKYKIQCALDYDFKDSQQDNQGKEEWVFKCKHPVPIIQVKIINCEAAESEEDCHNKERILTLSIYNNWQDSISKEELDKQYIINYVKVQEHIQKQIVEGKKIKNFSFPRMASDNVKTSSRYYVTDKLYVHELFVKMAQKTKSTEELITALNEVRLLASNILEVDKNNEKQNKIKENIDRLMNYVLEGEYKI